MKKALIVAGGVPQISLMQQLRERGIWTILVDGSRTPVALPYADSFYQVNIFDIEAVKAIAVSEAVDYVLTVCADQVLLVVSKIAEELGLPWYISYETACMVSDKERMKALFQSGGIPSSRFAVMEELETERTRSLRYPLIVKPVDAYSSKGVRKVRCEAELRSAFAEAKAISRAGRALVEEYFEGEELSVDLFVEDGKAKLLLLSNSDKVRDEERFVIFRGRFPARVSAALEEEIGRLSQRVAEVFGIQNGPMLIQMLTDGERLNVVECCARTGGAMKWLLIRHATGVDVIRAVIDLTLGQKPDIRVRPPETRYVVNDFIYCRAGIFERLEGFEEQLRLGNISEYRCLRPRGWRFSGAVGSSTDRICGVTFQADSLEEFNRKHRAFVESVRVADAEGNDIMRHDLLPELTEQPGLAREL